MAATLLTRTPHRRRRPGYRHRSPVRQFGRVTLLTEAAPTLSDGSGFDNVRFYRHTGSTLLVLATGVDRGGAVGFATSETWETASGKFALPNTRRHPNEKAVCIRKTAQVWTDFSTATQSDMTTAMNLALNQAGYTQSDGSAIS